MRDEFDNYDDDSCIPVWATLAIAATCSSVIVGIAYVIGRVIWKVLARFI